MGPHGFGSGNEDRAPQRGAMGPGNRRRATGSPRPCERPMCVGMHACTQVAIPPRDAGGGPLLDQPPRLPVRAARAPAAPLGPGPISYDQSAHQTVINTHSHLGSPRICSKMNTKAQGDTACLRQGCPGNAWCGGEAAGRRWPTQAAGACGTPLPLSTPASQPIIITCPPPPLPHHRHATLPRPPPCPSPNA